MSLHSKVAFAEALPGGLALTGAKELNVREAQGTFPGLGLSGGSSVLGEPRTGLPAPASRSRLRLLQLRARL